MLNTQQSAQRKQTAGKHVQAKRAIQGKIKGVSSPPSKNCAEDFCTTEHPMNSHDKNIGVGGGEGSLAPFNRKGK
jgi:hypothetical protein